MAYYKTNKDGDGCCSHSDGKEHSNAHIYEVHGHDKNEHYGESCGGSGTCRCEDTHKEGGVRHNGENASSKCGCGTGHGRSACGCGCEENFGSLKQTAFQFGTAAVFFILGILFAFIFYDIKLFNFLNLKLSSVFFLASWTAAGYKVLFTSFKNILRGKIFDENFLMSIATIGAFCLGEWSEGAAVMLFYNLGELVQNSAVEKSRKSIIGLMDLRPEFARIYNPEDLNGEKLINPESVKIGTLICIKPGEKIPLDGIITEGSAELDTSSMTGESLPRAVKTGDEVLAGFVNLTGVIIVKTERDVQNTAAAKMLRLIENAQNRKAKVERFITAFAKVYTPIVTAAAVLISIIPPILNSLIFSAPLNGFESFSPWISRGLVFLVISCPCAFVISVPLGYFGGIGGAAKKGILIKGADYVDALSKAGAVVLDKTGTLTNGVLSVQKIIPSKGASDTGMITAEQKEVLTYVLVAEAHSGHPIANAIRKYAAENLSVTEYEEFKKADIQNYSEIAGKGISGLYKGKPLFAGTESFVSDNFNGGISRSENSLSGTRVYAAFDGKYLGCIVLSDTVKTDSEDAVKELQALGVKRIEMLTGDNEVSAKEIAEKLKIRYSANLLPHEKVERFETISSEIKAENKNSTVIFAGDGINDAPVLARADAGIAMGGVGSDAAIEAADVVLMNDNPVLIAEAIKLSRFTRKIVWENIGLAFFIKIGFLGLGAFGIADMWGAVFADVGVALLAVFNSLRAAKCRKA
ncbi:heavy metal translocating P-type ATPase [Treponema pedis]|uniref:heavy metal translocating P-type ATPase n=1 Tax=Treponema pedis TaxID=409322 RepID=UPI00197F018A|nr:heavy metal translocating P-type ATPase [Treponema pedis]QSI05487.1 heavy metal translocating P-type ATPase [Treponema pedis]